MTNGIPEVNLEILQNLFGADMDHGDVGAAAIPENQWALEGPTSQRDGCMKSTQGT